MQISAPLTFLQQLRVEHLMLEDGGVNGGRRGRSRRVALVTADGSWALVYPNAWKRNAANFAQTEF
jgi:hypothetical protein